MARGRGRRKKTIQATVEQDREVKLIVSRAVFGSGVDLEAWESALRAAVLAAGAGVLEGLLEEVGSGRRRQVPVCECGAAMESRGQRPKQLLTVLGAVNWSRSRYQCPLVRPEALSGGRGVGCGRHGTFSGGAPDDGPGGKPVLFPGGQ